MHNVSLPATNDKRILVQRQIVKDLVNCNNKVVMYKRIKERYPYLQQLADIVINGHIPLEAAKKLFLNY